MERAQARAATVEAPRAASAPQAPGAPSEYPSPEEIRYTRRSQDVSGRAVSDPTIIISGAPGGGPIAPLPEQSSSNVVWLTQQGSSLQRRRRGGGGSQTEETQLSDDEIQTTASEYAEYWDLDPEVRAYLASESQKKGLSREAIKEYAQDLHRQEVLRGTVHYAEVFPKEAAEEAKMEAAARAAWATQAAQIEAALQQQLLNSQSPQIRSGRQLMSSPEYYTQPESPQARSGRQLMSSPEYYAQPESTTVTPYQDEHGVWRLPPSAATAGWKFDIRPLSENERDRYPAPMVDPQYLTTSNQIGQFTTHTPVSELWTYPAYTYASGFQKWWDKNVFKHYDELKPKSTYWDDTGQEDPYPAHLRNRQEAFFDTIIKGPGLVPVFAGMVVVGGHSLIHDTIKLKDPTYPVTFGTTVGGVLVEGMVTSYEQDPDRFIGEMAGSAVVFHGAGIVARPLLQAGKYAAMKPLEATGIIRRQTYGWKAPESVQMMSRAEALETVLENPRISGVSAGGTSVPAIVSHESILSAIKAGRISPVSKTVVTRVPGDVAHSTPASGLFMAVSRPGLIEPFGTYFTTRPGQGSIAATDRIAGGATGLARFRTPQELLGDLKYGIRRAVTRPRVQLIENVRTVDTPPLLRQQIYQSVRDKGHFRGPLEDKMMRLALEQSRTYGEPIAVPSPKRVIGDWKPENEVFLVFATEQSAKIAGTRFAGLTEVGYKFPGIVQRYRYGNMPPITVSRSGAIWENIRYNWDLTYTAGKIHSRPYLEAMAADINRKSAELSGRALSYPYEYMGHGLAHSEGVYGNLMTQRALSNTLRQQTAPADMRVRALLHDAAKIVDSESQPYPHAWATGASIRKGLVHDPDLLALPRHTQLTIARDIQLHTDIQPGLLSTIRYQPSHTAKALATADRLDLGRFGVTVQESKLFRIPEETLRFKIASTVDRLPIGFQTRFVETPLPSGSLGRIAEYPGRVPVGSVGVSHIPSGGSYGSYYPTRSRGYPFAYIPPYRQIDAYYPVYRTKYTSTYSPGYSPDYFPPYTPTYTPGYQPPYTPAYQTPYMPDYGGKYIPAYQPKSYPPTYRPRPFIPKKPPQILPTFARSEDPWARRRVADIQDVIRPVAIGVEAVGGSSQPRGRLWGALDIKVFDAGSRKLLSPAPRVKWKNPITVSGGSKQEKKRRSKHSIGVLW